MRRLLRPFLILLALIFLFEAWLWARLAPVVAWLVARLPLREIKARLAPSIDRLPPSGALILFAVPAAVLLPMKFIGLWLLARGYWLGALGGLAKVKVVGLGVPAFIFELTREKLLLIPSFRWLHDRILAWLAWAHALTDPIKR